MRVYLASWRDAAKMKPLIETELPSGCEVLLLDWDDSDVVAQVERADVIVGSRMPAQLAASAGRLRLFQVNGVGFEGVPLDALPAQTTVANATGHGDSIAEYVIFGCLAMARNLFVADRRLRRGEWTSSWAHPVEEPGFELRGRTMAVLGLGELGRAVWRLARCFGMSGIGLTQSPDRHRDLRGELLWMGALSDVEQAMQQADIVVIALPLSESTRGLIGEPELAALRPSAVIVNVGRAAIVQEAALYRALWQRRFKGAVLDVWYQYPQRSERVLPAHYPFHELDNVILTPHIAGRTTDFRKYLGSFIGKQIRRLAMGEPLENVVRAARPVSQS